MLIVMQVVGPLLGGENVYIALTKKGFVSRAMYIGQIIGTMYPQQSTCGKDKEGDSGTWAPLSRIRDYHWLQSDWSRKLRSAVMHVKWAEWVAREGERERA